MLEAKQNLQDETIARIRDIDERVEMLKRQYEASLAKMGVQTDVPPQGFAEFLSEKKIKPKDLAKFSGKPLTAEDIRSGLANKSAREQINYLQDIPRQFGFKRGFNQGTINEFLSGERKADFFIDGLMEAYKKRKSQAPQAEQREAKVAEEGRPQGFEEELKEQFPPMPELEGFGRRRRRTIRLPKDSPFHFSDGRNDVYRMKGKGFMTDIARKFANIFS
jgi:hypothetical protein